MAKVTHTSTYTLCLKLIQRGKVEGLAEKIDVYYANNRITESEYEELMSMLQN